MHQQPADTVRGLVQAFASQDREAFASFLDPRIEWISAENFIYADESPYRGVDAVLGLVFGRLQEDWAGFSLSADEILGSGDLVILNGRFRGIYKATAAYVDAQMVQVFQVDHGRIVRVQVYTDTAQFKDAINKTSVAGV